MDRRGDEELKLPQSIIIPFRDGNFCQCKLQMTVTGQLLILMAWSKPATKEQEDAATIMLHATLRSITGLTIERTSMTAYGDGPDAMNAAKSAVRQIVAADNKN